MVGLWAQKNTNKALLIVGIICSIIITVVATTSGALVVLYLEIAVLGCWFVRGFTRWVSWAVLSVILIFGFGFGASAFLYLSRYFGGTGIHRTELYTSAARHFFDWWLVGTKATVGWTTSHFGATVNYASDITSGYIREATSGGILVMIFFMLMIVYCFNAIKKASANPRFSETSHKFLLWTLATSLLGHTFSLLSVSYFDQSIIWFYMLISMIAAISGMPEKEPARL
jgi:hypothetical protein